MFIFYLVFYNWKSKDTQATHNKNNAYLKKDCRGQILKIGNNYKYTLTNINMSWSV